MNELLKSIENALNSILKTEDFAGLEIEFTVKNGKLVWCGFQKTVLSDR
jgi:hypothetical protein